MLDLELCRFITLTLSTGGATGLDLPHVVLCDSIEVKSLGYVVGAHCCRISYQRSASFQYCCCAGESRLTTINILLVGEDEKDDVAHFAVLNNAAEFRLGFLHAGAIA